MIIKFLNEKFQAGKQSFVTRTGDLVGNFLLAPISSTAGLVIGGGFLATAMIMVHQLTSKASVEAVSSKWDPWGEVKLQAHVMDNVYAEQALAHGVAQQLGVYNAAFELGNAVGKEGASIITGRMNDLRRRAVPIGKTVLHLFNLVRESDEDEFVYVNPPDIDVASRANTAVLRIAS